MATAKQLTALAKKVMLEGSVVITGADYDAERRITRLQVYFWDENESVMDIIEVKDLIDNWPDEGVYVVYPGGGETDCLRKVRLFEGKDDLHLRSVETDEEEDDIGDIPGVVLLEALEMICQLKGGKAK